MEADTFFVTAVARVTNRHRPYTANVAELQCGAVTVSFRPFTAEVVQAPAFAMAIITKLFGETTSIEVRATFAMFVNQTPIGEGRTVFVIQLRRFTVSDDVRNGRKEVVRVRRAALEC